MDEVIHSLLHAESKRVKEENCKLNLTASNRRFSTFGMPSLGAISPTIMLTDLVSELLSEVSSSHLAPLKY